jgi:microcystin degradation protein MlrC
MLDEANAGRTDVPETAALYARARAHEAEPGILAVSINAGFSEADITDMGPTVLVTHDRAESRADRDRPRLAHASGTGAARWPTLS